MTRTTAASIFTALAVLVIAFQIALVAGAPWGEYTLGGSYPGQLPMPIRLVPIVSALLIASFVLTVRARAGLLWANQRAGRIFARFIWVVVAYSALGTLLNAITPSAIERLIWLPVVIGLLLTSLRVARS